MLKRVTARNSIEERRSGDGQRAVVVKGALPLQRDAVPFHAFPHRRRPLSLTHTKPRSKQTEEGLPTEEIALHPLILKFYDGGGQRGGHRCAAASRGALLARCRVL